MKFLPFIWNIFVSISCLGLSSKTNKFSITDIHYSELPYQVSLQDANEDYEYGFGTGHFCSGTVISLRTVLTAAHCLVDTTVVPPYIRSPKNINVVMGMTNLYIPTSVTISFGVSSYVFNSDFNTFNYNNDIAMLLISGEIPLGDLAIYPIELPTVSLPDNTNCTVSGWGTIYQDGPDSPNLMSSIVPTVPIQNCSLALNEILPYGVICAGYFTQPAIPVNSCQGDSGGPLVYNNTIYGIMSRGVECGSQGYPNIYTDVLYFQSWINATNITLWNGCINTKVNSVLLVFFSIASAFIFDH